MVDLINNDSTGNLIAFIKKGKEEYYCLAKIEYWIGEWWNGYVDLSKDSLEELYFEYLNQFKIDFIELKDAYSQLIKTGNKFKIEGNKPSLFIDFELKLLVSNFYDQSLENRVADNWTGKYGEVLQYIPEEYKYW